MLVRKMWDKQLYVVPEDELEDLVLSLRDQEAKLRKQLAT